MNTERLNCSRRLTFIGSNVKPFSFASLGFSKKKSHDCKIIKIINKSIIIVIITIIIEIEYVKQQQQEHYNSSSIITHVVARCGHQILEGNYWKIYIMAYIKASQIFLNRKQ